MVRSYLWKQSKSLQQLRPDQAAPQGFTLIEAIIVIGILLVLAAVGIPAYQNYITEAKSARNEYSSSAAANDAAYSASLSAAKN